MKYASRGEIPVSASKSAAPWLAFCAEVAITNNKKESFGSPFLA
jgi:hypothetical protein